MIVKLIKITIARNINTENGKSIRILYHYYTLIIYSSYAGVRNNCKNKYHDFNNIDTSLSLQAINNGKVYTDHDYAIKIYNFLQNSLMDENNNDGDNDNNNDDNDKNNNSIKQNNTAIFNKLQPYYCLEYCFACHPDI